MSKYFEYTREENEYYALIEAESKKEADFVYWRDVMLTDAEKENTLIGLVGSYNATELTLQEAWEKVLSIDDDEPDFYKSIKTKNHVLLIDNDLI